MKEISKSPRILLVRLSSLGDIVLSTGIIRQIKHKYHNAQIDFLIDENFSEILCNNPYINQVIKYNKNNSLAENRIIAKNILEMNGKYDYIFDLHNNLRTSHFIKGLGVKIFKIRKRRIFKLKMVYLKHRPIGYEHIFQIYRETLAALNIKDDEFGSEVWLASDKSAQEYLPKFKAKQTTLKRIVVVPGATHNSKKWSVEGFAEVINSLALKHKFETIILGSKSETQICAELQNKINGFVTNLAGKTLILEAVEWIDKCDLMICNDSGLGHIAAARNVPVAVIYGSTVPELGFTPLRVNNVIIQDNSVECRPCTHIGRANCPKGHFNCMNNIKPSQILDEIERLLAL